MKAQLSGLNSSTMFSALHARPSGRQTLEILKRWDLRVEPLHGPNPYVGENTIVFLGTDLLRFPSRYLRVLPNDPRIDRVCDHHMCQIATEMGLLQKRKVRIVFVNERHVGGGGRFEGKHLEHFTHALAQLCGHRPAEHTNQKLASGYAANLSAAEKRELGISATRTARCEDWC